MPRAAQPTHPEHGIRGRRHTQNLLQLRSRQLLGPGPKVIVSVGHGACAVCCLRMRRQVALLAALAYAMVAL